MTDVSNLILGVDSRQVDKGAKSLDDFAIAGGRAEKSADALTKATNILAGVAKAAAGAFGLYKMAQYAQESAMLAARFETMGIVMKVAGNNAGYTAAQMNVYSAALQKNGISMLQSRDALTQLATAHIDLSKASAIGRAAQDLAVVANTNSSEAMARMIHGIKSGQIEVLRTLGLNVNFENSYKSMAAQLGVNATALTEQQKTLARTNAVLLESKNYAGIYEESMTTAGKAMSSLTRYSENLQIKIGEIFLPALADAVFKYTDALKAANSEMDKMGSSGNIRQIGEGLAGAFRIVYETVVVVGATVASTFDIIGRNIGAFGAQVGAILSGRFGDVAIIQKQVIADNAAANAGLDAFTKTILAHGSEVKKSTGYSEAAAIANGKTTMAAAEAASRLAKQTKERRGLSDAEKDAAAIYEQEIKARQQVTDKIRAESESTVDKTKALLLETESFGKSSAEIELLISTRYDHETQIMRERLAIEESTNACTAEAEALREAIAVREQYKRAATDNTAGRARQVTIDAEKKATLDMWKSIDQTAHDTFVSVANGNKDMWSRMKESAKNIFFDWLYSMTAKKWLVNVSAGFTGAGASGAAMAGTGGGGGGAGDWLSIASTLKDGFTGLSASFTSMAGTISGGLQSMGVEAGLSGSIGVAGSYAGAGLAGIGLGTMLAGDKVLFGMDGKTASMVGSAIGLVLSPMFGPLGVLAGGVTGGALNAAFGRGPKVSGTTTLAGQFGGEGFAGQYQTPWSQKGGWFRSGRSGVDVQGVGAEQQEALNNVVQGTKSVFDNLIMASGEANKSIVGWTFSINRQVSTQEQQNQLIIDLAESMGNYLIPSLAAFKKAGENLADTAVRLTDEIIVLNSFYNALGTTTRATISSADALANALGGVGNEANLMTSFIGTFAPAAQQTALTLEALTNSGLPMAQFLTTTEAWWAFAQTASTEQLAAILANQGAIKSWVDAMNQSSQAVAANIKSLQDKSIEDFKAARAATDSLRAFALSVRDLQRSLWAGQQTPLSSTYSVTRSQFSSINALAGQGDVNAQGSLSGSATAFLDAAKLQATSAIEYARDFAFVQNALNDTALLTEDAVTVADRQLTQLQQANAWLAVIATTGGAQSLSELVGAATGSAGSANAAVQAQADAQAAQAQAAAEAAQAVAQVVAAVPPPSQQAVMVPFSATNPNPANVAAKAAALNVANMAQAVADTSNSGRALGAAARAWDVYNALPSFAVGTNALTADGAIYAHKGEEIKPKAYVDADKAEREETNKLLREMKKELVLIKGTNYKIWQLDDKHDIEGMPAVRAA